MIETVIILSLFAALLYAYLQGRKQGRNAQKVSELQEHVDSVSKGLKAGRDFNTDPDVRKRVQDRFTE
jgi:Flp pilus assembly protein TadB